MVTTLTVFTACPLPLSTEKLTQLNTIGTSNTPTLNLRVLKVTLLTPNLKVLLHLRVILLLLNPNDLKTTTDLTSYSDV